MVLRGDGAHYMLQERRDVVEIDQHEVALKDNAVTTPALKGYQFSVHL
jgi:hypothetical protein